MATATPAATPFPWSPMLAIAIGLVSHAYSLSSLFPYVGYMVQQLGVAEDKDEAGQSYHCLQNCVPKSKKAYFVFYLLSLSVSLCLCRSVSLSVSRFSACAEEQSGTDSHT